MLRNVQSLSQTTQLQSHTVFHNTRCVSSKVNLKQTAKVPKKEIISKQVVPTKRETIGTTKKEFPQKNKEIAKESSKEATEPKKVKEEFQKIGTSKHIIKETVIATKKEDLEKETPKLD